MNEPESTGRALFFGVLGLVLVLLLLAKIAGRS
jgi:hypothetical protein